MRHTITLITVAALATSMIASLNAAQAGAMVSADVATSEPFVPFGKNATTVELRAFSREGKTTNQNFFGTLTTGGMDAAKPPNGAILPNVQNISVKKKAGVERYVPVLGLADQPKGNITQVGDSQTLFSLTGTYTGTGNQFQSATGKYLGAIASTNSKDKKPPEGAAAGAAFDPILIPGGALLAYSPMVDATFQIGDSSITAGVDIYAVDSTVFSSDDLSNFLNDGSPFENTLWHLNLAANGPVAGPSDVAVDFELNPLALDVIIFPTSYLVGLPGYSMGLSDAEVATLIDQAVDKAVTEALVLIGDTVQLQSFLLFPDGTFYAPINSVEYAEGVDAGLTTVPEPTSILLLASAILILLGFHSGRTRSPTPA
jgi:opacity protein-like surface antigen